MDYKIKNKRLRLTHTRKGATSRIMDNCQQCGVLGERIKFLTERMGGLKPRDPWVSTLYKTAYNNLIKSLEKHYTGTGHEIDFGKMLVALHKVC